MCNEQSVLRGLPLCSINCYTDTSNQTLYKHGWVLQVQLLQWFAQIWHRPKHLLISLLKMSPRSIVTHHLSSIGCFLILEEQKDIVRTQICHMHWQYRLPTHDWTPPELPCLVTPVFGIDHVLLSIWRADRRETVHQTAGHQTPTVWLPDKGLDSENDWTQRDFEFVDVLAYIIYPLLLLRKTKQTKTKHWILHIHHFEPPLHRVICKQKKKSLLFYI